MIHEIFSLIIKQNSMTPSHGTWYGHSDPHGGDPTNPKKTTERSVHLQNFTSFSPPMLYNRSYDKLDQHHCPGQAGFQTMDNLVTCRIIVQKRRGWETDMWVAAIDFKKASQQSGDLSPSENHSVSDQYSRFLTDCKLTNAPPN